MQGAAISKSHASRSTHRSTRWLAALVAGLAIFASACEDERTYTEVLVSMPDGSELAADLWLPVGGEGQEHPTIFIYTPYNRTTYRLAGLPLDSQPDYAYLIVDRRGRFGSVGARGEDENLGQDTYDVIDWIVTQDWSDGHVGMYGESALAVAQYRAASLNHPNLDAIVPVVGSYLEDYDKYYPGGVLREKLIQDMTLTGFVQAGLVVGYPSQVGLLSQGFWDALVADSDIGGDIDVPVLLIGGWYDHNIPGQLYAFDQMTNPANRLVIGPWTHTSVDKPDAGALSYPEAVGYASAAAVKFLDYHVRGVGSAPAGGPVEWFDMGTRTWKKSAAWPPSAAESTLYLHDGGVLSASAPADDGSSTSYVSDPLDPSPTIGGPEDNALAPNEIVGPQDQSPVEARGDAVVFSTGVLGAPLKLAGGATVKLFVSSDALDTDFMVRLTDVYPDGRSMLVVDSAVRARFREGYDKEVLLTPGEVVELEVELNDTALTFPAGHQLRIVVSSSNYNRFEVNANDGGSLRGNEQIMTVAENSIHHNATYPSRIVLPVVP